MTHKCQQGVTIRTYMYIQRHQGAGIFYLQQKWQHDKPATYQYDAKYGLLVDL
jgi:hypothetical protein